MKTWILRICLSIAVATFLYAAWDDFRTNAAFTKRGQQVAVIVPSTYTETTTTRTQLGLKVGETKTQSAELSIPLDHGRIVKVNRNLPDDVFAKMTSGQPVMMEYLPEDIWGSARFVGHPGRPWLDLGIALALSLGTVFLWRRRM